MDPGLLGIKRRAGGAKIGARHPQIARRKAPDQVLLRRQRQQTGAGALQSPRLGLGDLRQGHGDPVLRLGRCAVQVAQPQVFQRIGGQRDLLQGRLLWQHQPGLALASQGAEKLADQGLGAAGSVIEPHLQGLGAKGLAPAAQQPVIVEKEQSVFADIALKGACLAGFEILDQLVVETLDISGGAAHVKEHPHPVVAAQPLQPGEILQPFKVLRTQQHMVGGAGLDFAQQRRPVA